MGVESFHGKDYIRFCSTPDRLLYEAWVYEDGRPNRYAVDCEPVASLPDGDAANAVAVAAVRAMPILQAR